MALFKIAKGSLSNLSTKYPTKNEGYCYIAQDTDDNNYTYFLVDLDNTQRVTLSAAYAKTYPVTIKEWGAGS